MTIRQRLAMLRAELRGAFYRTRIDYECVVSKLSLHFGVRMLILSTCHVNERSYSAGGCIARMRICVIFVIAKLQIFSNAPRMSRQEAQLSPIDRAMRLVSSNFANYHATVQKLLIRQVLTKPMV